MRRILHTFGNSGGNHFNGRIVNIRYRFFACVNIVNFPGFTFNIRPVNQVVIVAWCCRNAGYLCRWHKIEYGIAGPNIIQINGFTGQVLSVTPNAESGNFARVEFATNHLTQIIIPNACKTIEFSQRNFNLFPGAVVTHITFFKQIGCLKGIIDFPCVFIGIPEDQCQITGSGRRFNLQLQGIRCPVVH